MELETLDDALAWCEAHAVTINWETPVVTARTPMTAWVTAGNLLDTLRALAKHQEIADACNAPANYTTVLGRKAQKLERRDRS